MILTHSAIYDCSTKKPTQGTTHKTNFFNFEYQVIKDFKKAVVVRISFLRKMLNLENCHGGVPQAVKILN